MFLDEWEMSLKENSIDPHYVLDTGLPIIASIRGGVEDMLADKGDEWEVTKAEMLEVIRQTIENITQYVVEGAYLALQEVVA